MPEDGRTFGISSKEGQMGVKTKSNKQNCSPSYLGGGHVADRAVGLDGLQLVQAPVQLLHGVHGQLLVRLICQQAAATQGHAVRTHVAHGALARHSQAASPHRSSPGGLLRLLGRGESSSSWPLVAALLHHTEVRLWRAGGDWQLSAEQPDAGISPH